MGGPKVSQSYLPSTLQQPLSSSRYKRWWWSSSPLERQKCYDNYSLGILWCISVTQNNLISPNITEQTCSLFKLQTPHFSKETLHRPQAKTFNWMGIWGRINSQIEQILHISAISKLLPKWKDIRSWRSVHVLLRNKKQTDLSNYLRKSKSAENITDPCFWR